MRNYKISRRNFLAVAGTLTAPAPLSIGHLARLRRLRKQHGCFQHSFFQRGKR